MKTLWARHRRVCSQIAHNTLAAAALVVGFLLRYEFAPPLSAWRMLAAALSVAIVTKLVVYRMFELRDLAWRYLCFADLGQIATANAVSSAAAAVGIYEITGGSFPRSVYILDFVFSVAFIASAHSIARMVHDRKRRTLSGNRPLKTIFIYGAGKAGITIFDEIRVHPELGYRVAGFLDDDPQKAGTRLHGVRVFNGVRVSNGNSSLAALAARYGVDEVLLALPRATGTEISAILDACHAAKIATRKIPPVAELIDNRVLVNQVREVRLEDLLGRAPALLDQDSMGRKLKDRVVLVTGAGGSIGSELCRQIARIGPSLLIGVDSGETALYDIEQDLRDRFPNLAFRPEVANIQNARRMAEVFSQYQPSIVFHAAAYKHVPMMEAHVFEALENNILGTRVLANVAAQKGVETFVLVSSDKAVRPTNVMGATKRVAELVCLAAGGDGSRTQFLAVRFGNVLGSNGSVIPRFHQQIGRGGPVTVTHPEMRRYFMTIPEAAQLVLQACAMGKGGEIFVLEMGELVRIVDLARKMILLSGYRPDVDIAIEFTGMRPGEKLYEELQGTGEWTVATSHPQIHVFTGSAPSERSLTDCLAQIERAVETRDIARAVLSLKELIPDYNPSGVLLRRAFAAEDEPVAATVGSFA